MTLTHKQSIFTLEFAALSYVAPERNRYRYRLEGLEEQWNEVDGERRVATYTSLPAGDYVFRVQGSNNDLLWNETGIRLAITVLPPWWGTWWFRAALVFCVAGVILGIHRMRMRGLRLTTARLERQVAERTRELKAARDSAELARDAAESANRAKSAFLSHMSHELRTPLSAILGVADLLREDGASEEQCADLNIIHRSGEHLLGMIDDILDIARIEAGRGTAEIAQCDLGRVVRDITDMIRVRASEKNLELRLVQSPEFPQFVETDAPKLRQILINLLANAVKNTERGSVTLRLDAKRAPAAGQVLLHFKVEDTGIGIAVEDQERIFEPFVQVGTQRQKGTGLGLPISRQFAVMLGGTLRVSSVPGQGSVFHLDVPAKCTEQFATGSSINERQYLLDAGQPEYRVLVVDDEPENRYLLQRLLVRAGFQVRVSEDGAEAIEMFERWRPHFIWMDLRMTGVGGAEAARRIRALDGGREVRIAAVTASESVPVGDGSMDAVIRKPYRPNEIFDCMAHLLGVQFRSDEAADSTNTLRPEALAALPDDLRSELKQAVLALNARQVAAVISRISELDAALGLALMFHANRLAFTKIWEALDEGKSDAANS